MGSKVGKPKAQEQEETPFKDSMAVMVTFWMDMGRTPEKRDRMTEKLYEIFFSSHPQYVKLFRDRRDAPKMLNHMFNVLVNLLATAKHGEAFDMIEKLGKRHANFGVPAEAFGHFLSSFEKALVEYFPHLFNARVQFCFAATINFLAAKMIEAAENEESRLEYTPRYPAGYFDTLDLEDWWSFASNDLCLQYLHLHLVTLLSSELTLFLREVLEYRKHPTQEKFQEIFNTYIELNAHIALNLSQEMRENVRTRYRNEGATKNMFDPLVFEVGRLLRQNSQLWINFKESKLWKEMLRKIDVYKRKHAKQRKSGAAGRSSGGSSSSLSSNGNKVTPSREPSHSYFRSRSSSHSHGSLRSDSGSQHRSPRS